jgi:hypothetical protein
MIESGDAPTHAASDFSTRHRIRRGFRFGYKLPLDDFMAFVDAAL